MFGTIKSWLNWPAKGFKNINDVSAYFKNNWLALLILFFVALIIVIIIKKIIGWFVSLLNS